MEYKIKIYGGEVKGDYFHTIAMVDIRKAKFQSAIYDVLSKERNGAAVFLWIKRAEVWEDRYEDPLLTIDINVVIDALRLDSEEYEYPLFDIALATLETMAKYYPDAKVVLFGY